jgi:hypothetical protein
MKAKGNKILWNLKTHWLSVFSLAKPMVTMYMLVKMVENSPPFLFAKVNFELLCDVNFLIFFFFVAHVGNNPCINQFCGKVRHICL